MQLELYAHANKALLRDDTCTSKVIDARKSFSYSKRSSDADLPPRLLLHAVRPPPFGNNLVAVLSVCL